MKKWNQIGVVIPSYNEGERLITVVNEVLKSQKVGEIIVVDDGSDSLSRGYIKPLERIKTVNVVTHSHNLGKTQALASGVKECNFDDIIFLDADLKGFTCKHVNEMIDIYQDNNLDILLAEREKEFFIFKIFGTSAAWGGEKIINKRVFKENKDILRTRGYLFEPVFLNKTLGRYNIGRYILKGVGQTWKIEKKGIAGLLIDFKMHWDYLRYLGPFEYFKQGFLINWYVKKYDK